MQRADSWQGDSWKYRLGEEQRTLVAIEVLRPKINDRQLIRLCDFYYNYGILFSSNPYERFFISRGSRYDYSTQRARLLRTEEKMLLKGVARMRSRVTLTTSFFTDRQFKWIIGTDIAWA